MRVLLETGIAFEMMILLNSSPCNTKKAFKAFLFNKYSIYIHLIQCVGFYFLLILDLWGSVRPKLGFGIGNRNQDQVWISVLEPKILLPKPKLPPNSFPPIFLMLLRLILNIS